MTYEEYLIKKRINKSEFEAGDPLRYAAWKEMYAQMHPNSFLVATKMQLNNIRLRYHLAEADIPKTETSATVAKPVMRRAASTMSSAKPADQASVPQETSQEEEITPKPRVVVRRPAALPKAVTPEGEASEAAETPAKVRAVIKRPVIARPVSKEDATGNNSEGSAAKPAKPRPVIKRPAALQKSTPEQDIDKAEQGQATEKPASASPRPRPVIKRPTVLNKPADEKSVPEAEMEGTDTGKETEVPKSPRPRPVIKRPAALQKLTAEESKVNDDKAAPIKDDKSKVDEPKVTTPRPRPVIKRPDPVAPETEKPMDTSTSETADDKPEEVKPKPVRPRPIIKRPPPKPDETGDATGV